MSARANFFKESCRNLETAAKQGFSTLQEQAMKEKRRISTFCVPEQLPDYNNVHPPLQPASYSTSIAPGNLDPLKPVTTIGDGNCLFRSMSILLFGNENYHIEMRVRTVIELALHIEHYADENTVGGADKRYRYAAPIRHTDANCLTTNGIIKMLQQEAINACKIYTWASIWQIFALSSGVGYSIKTVYPVTNSYSFYNDYNRIINPRKPLSATSPLTIMFTRVSAPPPSMSGNKWHPNHFEPCIAGVKRSWSSVAKGGTN